MTNVFNKKKTKKKTTSAQMQKNIQMATHPLAFHHQMALVWCKSSSDKVFNWDYKVGSFSTRWNFFKLRQCDLSGFLFKEMIFSKKQKSDSKRQVGGDTKAIYKKTETKKIYSLFFFLENRGRTYNHIILWKNVKHFRMEQGCFSDTVT